MIDIEASILSGLKTVILAQYPTAKVIKPTQITPTSFPTVTFYEADYERDSVTMNYAEPIAKILFQIDIWTSSQLQLKDFRAVVDNHMFSTWHMKLIMSREITISTTVYRYTMQYQTRIKESSGQMVGNY